MSRPHLSSEPSRLGLRGIATRCAQSSSRHVPLLFVILYQSLMPSGAGSIRRARSTAYAAYPFFLQGRHVLFGEWCAALHSLDYNRLPGLFIAFDLYDRKTGLFCSRQELHSKLVSRLRLKLPRSTLCCGPCGERALFFCFFGTHDLHGAASFYFRLQKPTGIPVVPVITRCSFKDRAALMELLETRSKFRDGPVEGVYLRRELQCGTCRPSRHTDF